MIFVLDFEAPNPDDFEEIQLARRLDFVPGVEIDRVVNSLRSLVEAFRSETENSRESLSQCNRVLRNQIICVVLVYALALLMGYGAWQVFGLSRFGAFAIALLPLLALAVFCLTKRCSGCKQQVIKSYFDNLTKYQEEIAVMRCDISNSNMIAESELNDWDLGAEFNAVPPTLH